MHMRAIRIVPVALGLGVLALASSCSRMSAPTDTSGPAGAELASVEGDPVVVAVGDIVCGTGTSTSAPCVHAQTAALTGAVAPAAVLLLGDNQYESGTLSDFRSFYDPTWGTHKAITWPSAGNHEYQTAGAAGYFDYFNGQGAPTGRAGDRTKGYYSFDLGSWHLIALNSNCAAVGGCGAGSPQEQWLRTDLAANPRTCTLAYWHHPRFSSGAHGNNSSMQAIWQALYDHGADLVLAGHDHDYERFAPQTATGGADAAKGIRSFVVGTGGKDLRSFSTIRANSALRNSTAFGVLKLTLRPSSYAWEFVPIPGHVLNDAGSAACITSEPPPPPIQTTLTIRASADAYTLESSPSTRFGTATTLLVDGSPQARTYLRFPVTGVTGKTVVSAVLRLYATDPSDVGGRLHRVNSTSWKEAGIRWSSQPKYNTAVIGSIGAVVANTWCEVDVKSQIQGDGTFSFALESPSSNGADYRAREAGPEWAPRLVIVVQ
jgi:hypothetical protein